MFQNSSLVTRVYGQSRHWGWAPRTERSMARDLASQWRWSPGQFSSWHSFNNFDLNCSRDKIFLFSYSFCSSSWFWTCSTNRTAPGLQGRASWHEYLIILSESKLREFLHPRSPEAAQVPGRGDRDDRGGGAGAARQGEAQGRGGGRGEWDEAPVRGPLRPGQGKYDYVEKIFWLCLKWRSSYVRHWRRKARSMNQRIDDRK